MRRDRIVERIWQRDHTVWKPDPAEIANRLGWLAVAEDMRRYVGDLQAFADEIRADRFKHVVLLGLIVLDSTVPGWVRRVTQAIDPARTLFIVSSKSGGTIEVMSFFKHFWARVENSKRKQAGENFIAITDPGTRLGALATQHGFRQTFLNPADIGGRYSALSYFGLVPAALIGMDLNALLDAAAAMMAACHTDAAVNPAAHLGATLGGLAKAGRDKLAFVTSPSIATFGLWAEQLIAESTGKDGRGIVPIALEPPVPPEAYSSDRLFAVLRVDGDANAALDRHVAALESADHPVVKIALSDRYGLGAEFFRWEMATAIAGHVLGIQPFDQPNVQESKDNTQRVLDRHKATGALPDLDEPPADLAGFLRQARPGDYVALMAYLDASPDVERALSDLRAVILQRTHLPNTLGYGPRFLHSTGQLHKGGANNGLFVQLTANSTRGLSPLVAGGGLPVPGELFSFDVLAAAQASGDLASLRTHGRRAIRIELGRKPAAAIRTLTQSIGGAVATPNKPAARKIAAARRPAARRKTATPRSRNPKPVTRRNKSK
jgi:glucose-6-phosphate isomerase/transaldolase/glucose-6-phosphate isomerase